MRGSEAVSLVHHKWVYSHWMLRTTCACWFEKPMRSIPYQWSANAYCSARDLTASQRWPLGFVSLERPAPPHANAVQQLAERRLAHVYNYVLCSDKWL